MRVFLFITVLLFGLNSNAQKIDCSSQTNEYQEFLNVNNFAEAFTSWEFVKNKCPKQSELIYTDGFKIVQYKIENAKDEEEKEAFVRQLMKLYDQYYKYFPQSIEDYTIYKALALIDNSIDADNEIYNLLDSGFNSSLDKVTSANAIYYYFKLLTEKNQNGDSAVSDDKVVATYTSLSNQIAILLEKNPSEKDSYSAAKRAINALADKFLTCDVLTKYYESKQVQNQDNVAWLQASLTVMSEKCSATPIFLYIAEKFYALKVSPESANYLATASLKNRKFDDAKRLFLAAAELEQNSSEKANKYYNLATGLYSSDKPKAKELLLKSLEFNPKLGKSYLFLAQLYANSAAECAKTEFEKKAVYYLAIETIKKAAIADQILETNVAMFVKDFSKESLSAVDISKAKMNGKTVVIGCWINEKITLSK
ncbi:tetratricopeptide repeat protein [Flavobacterium sp.]